MIDGTCGAKQLLSKVVQVPDGSLVVMKRDCGFMNVVSLFERLVFDSFGDDYCNDIAYRKVLHVSMNIHLT